MLNKEEVNKTLNRLKNHPGILESVKELLDVAEGVKGIEKADDIEFALIPEVRGLGKKVIQDWAEHQCEKQEIQQKDLRKHSKKK